MAITIQTSTVGNPVNRRAIQDANYVTPAVGVPANGITVFSNSLDLVQTTPFSATERVTAVVTLTGTSTVASSGTIGVQWQDSADNSSFTNVSEMGAASITATANNSAVQAGSAEFVATGTLIVDRWMFPPSLRRYVRVAVASSSANITAGTGLIGAAIYF